METVKKNTETTTEEERTYVKDLLLKYFQYKKQNNHQKRKLILSVIFDVLRFNHDEKQEVEKIAFSKKLFLFN